MGYNLSTNQLTCKGDDGSPSFLGGTEAMLDAEYITALGSNIRYTHHHTALCFGFGVGWCALRFVLFSLVCLVVLLFFALCSMSPALNFGVLKAMATIRGCG